MDTTHDIENIDLPASDEEQLVSEEKKKLSDVVSWTAGRLKRLPVADDEKGGPDWKAVAEAFETFQAEAERWLTQARSNFPDSSAEELAQYLKTLDDRGEALHQQWEDAWKAQAAIELEKANSVVETHAAFLQQAADGQKYADADLIGWKEALSAQQAILATCKAMALEDETDFETLTKALAQLQGISQQAIEPEPTSAAQKNSAELSGTHAMQMLELLQLMQSVDGVLKTLPNLRLRDWHSAELKNTLESVARNIEEIYEQLSNSNSALAGKKWNDALSDLNSKKNSLEQFQMWSDASAPLFVSDDLSTIELNIQERMLSLQKNLLRSNINDLDRQLRERQEVMREQYSLRSDLLKAHLVDESLEKKNGERDVVYVGRRS